MLPLLAASILLNVMLVIGQIDLSIKYKICKGQIEKVEGYFWKRNDTDTELDYR